MILAALDRENGLPPELIAVLICILPVLVIFAPEFTCTAPLVPLALMMAVPVVKALPPVKVRVPDCAVAVTVPVAAV